MLKAGCEYSCSFVDNTGSNTEHISSVSSVFPKFSISSLLISTESFGLTVTFVFVSIFPSILSIFVLSGANVTTYLSGVSTTFE